MVIGKFRLLPRRAVRQCCYRAVIGTQAELPLASLAVDTMMGPRSMTLSPSASISATSVVFTFSASLSGIRRIQAIIVMIEIKLESAQTRYHYLLEFLDPLARLHGKSILSIDRWRPYYAYCLHSLTRSKFLAIAACHRSQTVTPILAK
jgi:hypothetical protein